MSGERCATKAATIKVSLISVRGVPSLVCRMVLHEGTEEVFALKSMLREDIKAQRSEQSVLDEKDLMAEVAHPFIVNLVNTYKSSKRLYMLMECVQGGELYSRIHTNAAGALDPATVEFYAANVAVALNHLHAKDIVYRDLKPENILVDGTGYLKVCDFGFAVRLPLGQKTYTLVRPRCVQDPLACLVLMSALSFAAHANNSVVLLSTWRRSS